MAAGMSPLMRRWKKSATTSVFRPYELPSLNYRWRFDDPKKEHVCEESDDDVILVKDRHGRVIGFERLNFLSPKQRKAGGGIPLEVQMV